MLLKIAKEIVESYPHTEIGYVIAKIDVKKTDSYIENIKSILIKHLNDSGITSKNYSDHPQIAGWRNVFKNFGMSHKTHRSSVEALVKRIVTGGKMWSISNVVDLYNCCSVLSMLPMGGYDLAHIKNKIELRYGREGDMFDPLGMTEPVTIDSKHAVYADDDKVICWLWNFRDSKFTSISESTKHAIFFLDSAFPMAHIKMKDAILLFQDGLSKIEGTEITHNGILSKKNMEVEIGFENHDRTITDENEHGLFDALLNKTIVFKGVSGKNHVVKNNNQNSTAKKEIIPKQEFKFVPAPIESIATKLWAIHFAATGDLENLKKIHSHSPDLINSKDYHHSTILMHAAIGDHDQIASYVIEANPNVINEKNDYGESALDLANKHNSQRVLKVLAAFSN